MKLRPPDWSKEQVLRWLRDNPSGKVSELCRLAAGAVGLPWLALYHDVRDWKHQDPSFRDAYRDLMRERGAGSPPGRPRPEQLEGLEDWKVRFCEVYQSTKDRYQAALIVGVKWTTVYERLKESSPVYDKEFSDAVDAIEAVFLGKAERITYESLDLAEKQKDPRTAAWIALEILKRRDPRFRDRQDVKVSGTVKHEHQVLVRQQNAMRLAEERGRRLFERSATSPAIAAEPETIEAEFEELSESRAADLQHG